MTGAAVDDDPYLWLEEVDGEQAMSWVRERNAAVFAELAEGARYAELCDSILAILDADDRIPYVARRGDFLYNFWRDAAQPRGVWRRTTLDSYRAGEPEWDVLVDIDALAADEDEHWVWKGATGRYPDYDRFLIRLSRGGADATVVREWDLATRAFVADGFNIPEAKTRVSWIGLDSVYVGTGFGAGSLTDAGYPRTSRRWQRGTPLAEAEVVFEGRRDDVSAGAWCDKTPGYVRHFAWRSPDFFTRQEFVRVDGSYVLIDVPDDADTDVRCEWLLIRPRSAWSVNGVEYQAGSLLAARFTDWMAGDRTLSVLFEPDAHTSLTSWSWTKNFLILTLLSDVKTVLTVLAPHDGWRVEALPDVPRAAEATIVGTDPNVSDEYFLDTQSFIEPATLRRGVIGARAEVLRAAPDRFDADGLEVNQYVTRSKDGTRVPYFVVGRLGDTPRPVLMTGYGGFEVSLTPSYSGTIGRGWIERGGVYVVANIRGGGEYGPLWHQAAMREKRPRAYEDFAAVARDLVERGITTPSRLGIRGGSNGGLLMGNMLVSYPELFGAIVCEVPLLDMRRYHLLPAGASWMAEWGNPDDGEDWAYLRDYSPYHLVRPDGAYPPVLIVTSTRDDRVHPGHARKMVARMLQYGLDVRYFENIEGGHAGAANNEQTAVKWGAGVGVLVATAGALSSGSAVGPPTRPSSPSALPRSRDAPDRGCRHSRGQPTVESRTGSQPVRDARRRGV